MAAMDRCARHRQVQTISPSDLSEFFKKGEKAIREGASLDKLAFVDLPSDRSRRRTVCRERDWPILGSGTRCFELSERYAGTLEKVLHGYSFVMKGVRGDSGAATVLPRVSFRRLLFGSGDRPLVAA